MAKCRSVPVGEFRHFGLGELGLGAYGATGFGFKV